MLAEIWEMYKGKVNIALASVLEGIGYIAWAFFIGGCVLLSVTAVIAWKVWSLSWPWLLLLLPTGVSGVSSLFAYYMFQGVRRH